MPDPQDKFGLFSRYSNLKSVSWLGPTQREAGLSQETILLLMTSREATESVHMTPASSSRQNARSA